MSQCQAKAKRRQMANGYAHLGNSLRRPTVAGMRYISVSDSIAKARRDAQSEARRSVKKK